MMKIRPLLCLIAVMLITSFFCMPITYADNSQTDVSYKADFLKAIGVLDNNLLMDEVVTRGIFAAYTAHLYGEIPESNEASLTYHDVSADDSYCSAISRLTQEGLLNGYIDGTFRAERPIKVTEATKVIVDMLGYKYVANIKGGYPTGYTIAALNLGLYKGLNLNQSYFYGEDFVKLLYNAIDVDVLLDNGIKMGDGETYVDMHKIEGRTVLTENLNMYRGKGTVEASPLINFKGVSINDKQIWLDGFAVNVPSSVYYDLVGCYVEYVYYQPDDDDQKELVYAKVENDTTLTLTKDTFMEIDGLKLTYSDDDNRNRKADLDTTVKFAYNGNIVGYSSSYFTNFKRGTINLIDSDADGDYDLVKIEDYKSFVIDSINEKKMIVESAKTAYDSKSLNINPDNYEIVVIIDADGKEIEFANIGVGDIISYYKNSSQDYLKVYVSKNVTDGTLDSISTDSGDSVYTISDKSYKLPGDYMGKTVKLGDSVKVYVDVFGYIADIRKSSDDGYISAFLISSSYEDKRFKENFYFKVKNAQNKVIILQASKYIKYNGEKKKVKDLPELLSANMDLGGGTQGVICYKLNENGLVEAIETNYGKANSYINENGRLRIAHSTYDDCRQSVGSSTEATAKSYYYSNMLDSKLVMDNNTVIFSIPNKIKLNEDSGLVEKDETPYSESQINVVSRSSLTDRTEYTAEAYVLYNDAPSAKAVILFASIENNIPLEENLATVVKYESILTENGDRERQLSVMVEGIERTFAFADNVSLWTDDGTGNPIKSVFDTYTIKPGDTFRYGTDIDGNIDKMEMIYTIKDGWIRGASAYNTEKLGANLAYGKVVANDGTYTRILMDNETQTGFMQDYYAIPQSHYTAVTILTITEKGCEITSGSISEATVGDYVINYRHLMAAVGFVVIKDLR